MLTRPRLQMDATADRLGRPARRGLVLVALLGYPILVAAWIGLPAVGITGLPWLVVVTSIAAVMTLAGVLLYRFQRSLAQSPEDRLDERQVAVRDRAYLHSYRILSGGVLLGLLAAAIAPDLLDRPLSVSYETMQPLLWAAILYSIILPSAVVAWQERDLDDA